MSNLAESHICTTCSKSYKRREHLQRHTLTHLARRPYRCSTCSATFVRTDILRRHSQTCGVEPSSTTNFRRRRACDRCARQKKACDLEQPCRSCQVKSKICEYSYNTKSNVSHEPTPTTGLTMASGDSVDPEPHLACEATTGTSVIANSSGDTGLAQDLDIFFQGVLTETPRLQYGNDTLDWFNFLGVSDNGLFPETTCLDVADSNRHFKFLYNFTSRTGLSSTFDCGSLAQREKVLALLSEKHSAHIPQETVVTSAENTTIEAENTTSWLFDPLVMKIHDIVVRLKEIVINKPRNSSISLSWTPTSEQQCLEFFSPSNIRGFLTYYWAIWHPNVNFVHKPTFDPTKSKSSLLAAMVVIGACVSPSLIHNTQAKIWFDCVEEMVFSDEDFCSDSYTSGSNMSNNELQRSKIQALQAAYMVCLYQNWEGSDASRRRIRRYRFSTLVSTVRDNNTESFRDVTCNRAQNTDFSWSEFIAQEELTRTFLWVFLLDTSFVIFNNLPPRMVIRELQMRLACPESCFQASTAEECAAAVRDWTSQPSAASKISLHKAIECFYSGELAPYLLRGLASLGPLNLFVVISAFHILIFQRMNSFGDCGPAGAIHNALRNWRGAWELYISELSTGPPHVMVDSDSPTLAPQDMWKRVGFMRHAYEFWLLADLIIQRMILKSMPENGLGPDQSYQEAIVDPVLPNYDQNNMQQMNELIVSFENARIM